jgi:Family of unknown function (DUF6152)
MDSRDFRSVCLAFACISSSAVLAHHTYTMFDPTRPQTLAGTVAKFEWTNPHAYIWMYVPSKQSPGKYDLWSFENGAPTVLARQGWSKDVLHASDKISVLFAPLRDGRTGGHCIRVTLPDGRVLECPGPANAPPKEANQ